MRSLRFTLSNFYIYNMVLLTVSLCCLLHPQDLLILYPAVCTFWPPSSIWPTPRFPLLLTLFFQHIHLPLVIYHLCLLTWLKIVLRQLLHTSACRRKREVCFSVLEKRSCPLCLSPFILIRFPREVLSNCLRIKTRPLFSFQSPCKLLCSGIRLELTFSQLPQFYVRCSRDCSEGWNHPSNHYWMGIRAGKQVSFPWPGERKLQSSSNRWCFGGWKMTWRRTSLPSKRQSSK